MENWVMAYSTDKLYMAEIAKQVLFENGIQSVIVNKKDSTYLFGYVEVHVKQEHVIRSKHLLSTLEDTEPLNEDNNT